MDSENISNSIRPLSNRTNVDDDRSRSSLSQPSGSKTAAKRPSERIDDRVQKRAKVVAEKLKVDEDYEQDSDSDVEMIDLVLLDQRARKQTFFGMLSTAEAGGPCRRRARLPMRPILESFISSHKSDVYKCTSLNEDYYLAPPYACAYSNGAKSGKMPILAVATEQGSVHIFNTSKRRDWDVEPSRCIFQPHENGIFDVKWNRSDTLLATAAGDKTASISDASTGNVTRVLRGHTGTVKCAAWDPHHLDLLCTGGRDGGIRIWDLRVAERKQHGIGSVLSIGGAHENTVKMVKRGRKGKVSLLARSVTSVAYSEGDSNSLVSCGSSDGILRCWDIRCLHSRTKDLPQMITTPLLSSPLDPTISSGSRPRGLISASVGSGPTANLLFALGADSLIHTYDMTTLQPISQSIYGHERMHSPSFYVKVAVSPCGQWLASGCTDKEGSAFLFDISDAGKTFQGRSGGIQLKAQKGEVGAVDWAAGGVLATCAEEGTARIWRSDEEIWRTCVSNPRESQWDWSWAVHE